MKKLSFFFIIAVAALLLVSCQDKNKKMLCKKWDCVKVENLDPPGKTFKSPEDSVAAINMNAALKELNWNFNNDNKYQCSVGSKIMTSGTYELTDEGKTLICISSSKNTTNRYTVTVLTEDEMVLSNNINNVSLIMHFKPH